MPSHRFAHLAPLLLSLAAGCVLVEPVSGDATAELRDEQRAQAERVARSLCAGYYACDCQDPYPEHTTEAACFEMVLDGLVGRLEQGLDRGLDYDPACLDAYAELVEGLGCTPSNEITLDLELWLLSDQAARCRTYHGAVDPGQECEPLATARGDDCEPDHACSDFAMCMPNEALGEGEPCQSETDECAPGLWCVRDWTTDGGTCTRLPAVGESCATLYQCDLDGWCDSPDYVCRPWATPGQACEGGDNSLDTCGGFDAHCDAGTCVAAPVAGEPCGQGCALGLTCTDDVCVPRRAAVCDLQESLP